MHVCSAGPAACWLPSAAAGPAELAVLLASTPVPCRGSLSAVARNRPSARQLCWGLGQRRWQHLHALHGSLHAPAASEAPRLRPNCSTYAWCSLACRHPVSPGPAGRPDGLRAHAAVALWREPRPQHGALRQHVGGPARARARQLCDKAPRGFGALQPHAAPGACLSWRRLAALRARGLQS